MQCRCSMTDRQPAGKCWVPVMEVLGYRFGGTWLLFWRCLATIFPLTSPVWGNVVRRLARLPTGKPGVRIMAEAKYFLFFEQALVPIQLNGYRNFFQGQSGRGLILTAHYVLHELVSGALPLFPPLCLHECYKYDFPFFFFVCTALPRMFYVNSWRVDFDISRRRASAYAKLRWPTDLHFFFFNSPVQPVL
jgi:hypothetical protein